MSHHLDSPASRRDPRLNLTDLYVFDGEEGTVFAMIVNTSLAGAARVPGFHPEARYEFKVHLDNEEHENLAYRFVFGAATGGDPAQAFGIYQLTGATLKVLDRDQAVNHGLFRVKLQAVGFGAFVPFFFVSTGLSLDLHGLASPGTLARVPVFLAGLLVVRAIPALLYRPLAARPGQLIAAGLLQATSISIPIVAGTIGVDLGLIRPENYAALVAAGLLSVIIFPLLALPRPASTARPRRRATRQLGLRQQRHSISPDRSLMRRQRPGPVSGTGPSTCEHTGVSDGT